MSWPSPSTSQAPPTPQSPPPPPRNTTGPTTTTASASASAPTTAAQRTLEARRAFTASLHSAASGLETDLLSRARNIHANTIPLEAQQADLQARNREAGGEGEAWEKEIGGMERELDEALKGVFGGLGVGDFGVGGDGFAGLKGLEEEVDGLSREVGVLEAFLRGEEEMDRERERGREEAEQRASETVGDKGKGKEPQRNGTEGQEPIEGGQPIAGGLQQEKDQDFSRLKETEPLNGQPERSSPDGAGLEKTEPERIETQSSVLGKTEPEIPSPETTEPKRTEPETVGPVELAPKTGTDIAVPGSTGLEKTHLEKSGSDGIQAERQDAGPVDAKETETEETEVLQGETRSTEADTGKSDTVQPLISETEKTEHGGTESAKAEPTLA